jgi:glycosyltransferase involved in cell wall biosynthesis
MTKIKIVHILHCVGGVDVSLRLILENINDDKFQNVIIHGHSDTKQSFVDLKKNKVNNYNVSITRDISLIKDLLSVIQTYKILKKEKPQIIHAHSAKGGVIGRIVGGFLGVKVLYTPQAFSYLSTNNGLKRKIFLFIEKVLISKSNYILASSNSEKTRAIDEVGYKNENVLLFNNSINAINTIAKLTIEKTWPDEYICTVGRPSYQKNIELMIRVFAEVKKENNIHLVITGVGHHSDKLEDVKKLLIELNLSNSVTLIDWTDRENIFHIISKSKLYLSTARYEGLPYSVIEALALGKACVVSNCDGNKDLIENNYNGFVINDENIYEYATKINFLLKNESLLKKMSENAKLSFDENYNIVKNIAVLETIYNQFAMK